MNPAASAHSKPLPHTRSGHGGADPAQNLGGPVLSDDPNDDPAHLLEHLEPTDVFDVLPPIRPVVLTVIFHRDHAVLPAQVEVGDRHAVNTDHRYLRLRPRQARIDQQQPQVALSRRLRTSINQLQRRLQSPQPGRMGWYFAT